MKVPDPSAKPKKSRAVATASRAKETAVTARDDGPSRPLIASVQDRISAIKANHLRELQIRLFPELPDFAPQVIHDFGNGAAGAHPFAPLTLALNGNLYGTTSGGGAYNRGTVFELSPSGNFAGIHDFSPTEGGAARGGLVDAADGNLYGTAQSGPGIVSSGILYSIAE